MKTLVFVLFVMVMLTGCVTHTQQPKSITEGVVTINQLPSETINFICNGKIACSEMVLHDNIVQFVTIWCSENQDYMQCVIHELDHVARRSSSEYSNIKEK